MKVAVCTLLEEDCAQGHITCVDMHNKLPSLVRVSKYGLRAEQSYQAIKGTLTLLSPAQQS